MELQDFLDHVNRGAIIEGGSEQHRFMHRAAQEALRIVAELNTGYRTSEEVLALLSQLTGTIMDESVTVFPPFYCEFGKNLTLGKGAFINMGCRFQDAGGITIGEGALVGVKVGVVGEVELKPIGAAANQQLQGERLVETRFQLSGQRGVGVARGAGGLVAKPGFE